MSCILIEDAELLKQENIILWLIWLHIMHIQENQMIHVKMICVK